MNQHDENPPQANARHEEIDWLKTPYYDGKDTLLKQQPYCYACKDQIAGLKRCSRCNVAWYCSAECQKKHFDIHREVCKQVAKDRKNMEQEAVVIRNWYNEDTNAFENLLETRVGDFPSPDTHDYLEARHCLADDLWDVAYDFGVKEVWEKSRFHYQELLRLDAKSPVLLRYRLPYILLYLNRDDEAFSYIRYWLNFDKLDEEEILTRHKQSREGEWLYPIEPNCRFLDIFQECPPIKNQREAAPFLMVIAIIKMRIVAAHDAISRALDFALTQTDAIKLQPVRSIIQEMLVGIDPESQRHQLAQVFNKLHPFLLDLLGMYEEVSEYHHSVGVIEVTTRYPVPLNMTLSLGLRAFYRVPGAAEILRSHIGMSR